MDFTASDISDYLGGLVVTQGGLIGEPFAVLDWQSDIIEALPEYRRLAFSIGRGNGKTCFLSALGCTAIDPVAPMFQARGEVLLAASSLTQAGIAFDHIKYFLGAKIQNRRDWRIADNHHTKAIEHRPTGTVLKCIGSDPRRAHGHAPSFAICDEPAQWGPSGLKFYNAIRTGMGKQNAARLFAIGTKPDSEEHWFSTMLDVPNAITWARTYAADQADIDEGLDFDLDVIRKANPSYDHLPNLREEIQSQIVEAELGGEALASYRAYNLNMGTPETDTIEKIVSPDDWSAVASKPMPPRAGPVAIAVDLGGGISMTAVSFYWPETGRLESYGAYPAHPNLHERGKLDGVGRRYVEMEQLGELFVYPGRKTNNVLFLTERFAEVQNFKWLGIAADNYAKTDIAQVMLEMGLSETLVDHRRVGKGPSGSEDVRAFQSEVLSDHLRPGRNRALTLAVRQAKLKRDENGNAALTKARLKGRIDVLQSGILAVGMGYRWRKPAKAPSRNEFWDRMIAEGEYVARI